MTDSSGRLTHAPVVYALCEIRFSAILKMAEYLPSIQEALRPRYPRFRHELANTIELGLATGFTHRTESRWILNDADEKNGYLIRQAGFVYHTTAYADFNEFLHRTLDGIQEVAKVANIALVERIGLRYVDFIAPDLGEDAATYLHPGLAGMSLRPLGFQQEAMQLVTTARTDAGRLVLKAFGGIHQQVVPGDLQPLTLKARVPQPERQTLLLDTDHFTEEGFSYDPKQLETVLRQLHIPISRVFRAAITEHAYTKWK